ncbi:MAG: hypothetical protein ACXVXD_16520 [Nocardioidaceae bacterium]
MTRTPALPLSLTHAAALAHIADLRAEAEREHLTRGATPTRHLRSWLAAPTAALRDRVAGALPGGRALGHRAPCPTC